ncbi:hypothetical protein EV363DRAFT_1315298 [Boletus edulis]|uniref:Uncharacterized protein n=1 Tax=Boletus edulis BED1 TaxID=1328754 RepID=A0AAD4GDS8_BOLED|nr:hypothetical protein EV363DRAFT_1315298 [Boletus edulis]KAF8418628.1 hypothetical protein L210DRAFT_3578849 [Boletus edulis BED1]KAF8437294.1 hypothetical protein L210DRAFT_3547410 [Boletus edulis BED1]
MQKHVVFRIVIMLWSVTVPVMRLIVLLSTLVFGHPFVPVLALRGSALPCTVCMTTLVIFFGWRRGD